MRQIMEMIVVRKEDLKVSMETDGNYCTFTVTCSGADLGKLIGKGGSHYRAFVDWLKGWAKMHGRYVLVNRIERNDDRATVQYGRFSIRQDWPKQKVLPLVRNLAVGVFRHEHQIEVSAEDEGEFTRFTVKVSPSESEARISTMLSAFNSILRAVGSSLGRSVTCKIIQRS